MKISCLCVAIVAGQDLFLAPLNATAEESTGRHRRRRRRRSTVPATCFGDDLPSCVNQCMTNDESANFKKCVGAGSNNCADSQCCTKPGWSCFVKNAYWSSCAPACKKGVADSRGEMWDCTPVSPSNCASLSTCVKGCHSACPSQELQKPPPHRPTRGPDPPNRGSGAPGCRGGSMQECKKVCHYGDAMLTKLCNIGCEESCPLEPEKHCPKENLSKCVVSCEDESKGPQHDAKCEKDGATNCLHSRCCQNPSDKCFTKNPYWAACTDTCPKGKKNPLDNQFWDCKELKPRVTCDAWKYRTCVSTCATECE